MSDSPIYDDTHANNTWKDYQEPLAYYDANTRNNDIEHNTNTRSVSSDKTVHFIENVESFSPDSSYSTDLADYFYLPPDENGDRTCKCYYICSYKCLISLVCILVASLMASLYYIFVYM